MVDSVLAVEKEERRGRRECHQRKKEGRCPLTRGEWQEDHTTEDQINEDTVYRRQAEKYWGKPKC